MKPDFSCTCRSQLFWIKVGPGTGTECREPVRFDAPAASEAVWKRQVPDSEEENQDLYGEEDKESGETGTVGKEKACV